jgi:hypothetical protein
MTRQGSGGPLSDALLGTAPAAPRELQRQGMSFADRFALEWDAAAELLAGPGREPSSRVAVLAWRIQQTSQALDIAVGPDPRLNLLDLVVFLQAGEWALRQGMVQGMPETERTYLASMYGRLRAETEEMLEEVLLPEQRVKLQEVVDGWFRSKPDMSELAGARLTLIPGVRMEEFADLRKATGLLANLRRWMGQVNTSLLFGERVLFVAERTPRILSQQTDLTLAQIAQDFPLATWQPDLAEVGDWVEELPVRFGKGWSAAAGETDWSALTEEGVGLWQETKLAVGSSREFLQAATGLSLALQTTLEEVQAWWRAEDEAGTAASATALLEQAQASLDRLDQTIAGLNSLLEATGNLELEPLQAAALAAADGVIDRLFYRAVQLLLLAFVGGVLLLLLARLLFRPVRRVPEPSSTPSAGE